jgi:hypothetical protein
MYHKFLSEEQSTEALIKLLLPFINEETGEGIKSSYNKMRECPFFSNLELKFPAQASLKELLDLQDFLKNVMTIALMEKRKDCFPEPLQNQIPTIENRINENLDTLNTKAFWRGQGECYEAKTIQPSKNEVKRFERFFVRCILKCLYSFWIDEENFYIGKGYEKVGRCPNCEIFFEKKRKNQEYCSEKCRKAAQMRRLRESKK